MRKFVIIGGNVGWMAVSYLYTYLKNDSITLIESPSIPKSGFGEGTVPNFTQFLGDVNVDRNDFENSVNHTIKLGISFKGWPGDNSEYNHDFNINGGNPHAYHIDTNQACDYFKNKFSSKVNYIIDDVVGFDRDGETINKVKTKTAEYDCDFLIDCSGISRITFGKEFGEEWISTSDELRVNSVLSFTIPKITPKDKPQRTDATSMKNGWCFRIPLQDRENYGYLHDNKLTTIDECKSEIKERFGNVEFKRYYEFESGYYNKTWVGNTIVVGMSSHFFEPIEATSIMICLMQMKKLVELNFTNRKGFNDYVNNVYKSTLSFIRYHYVCDRDDTEFWKRYKTVKLTKELKSLLNNNGKISDISERKFNSIMKDTPFTLKQYRLLNQYNFVNKSNTTLL